MLHLHQNQMEHSFAGSNTFKWWGFNHWISCILLYCDNWWDSTDLWICSQVWCCCRRFLILCCCCIEEDSVVEGVAIDVVGTNSDVEARHFDLSMKGVFFSLFFEGCLGDLLAVVKRCFLVDSRTFLALLALGSVWVFFLLRILGESSWDSSASEQQV